MTKFKVIALIIGVIVVLTLMGCSQDNITPITELGSSISGTQELVLNEEDLLQLGMISNGTDCQIYEYQTDENSPPEKDVTCFYTIPDLNNTEVIIDLKKFANLSDLNGTYQYSSQHLFSADGLISENSFGDQSRFRVNSVNDYGGQFDDPNVFFYHLWICKENFLIHITSKGSNDADEYITDMGDQILSKFE